MVIASETVERGCILSPPGTVNCQEHWGWWRAPARRRAASSSTIGITFLRIIAGRLLVTSWGDHRIEQFRLEPRGASFRAIMKPVVAGGEDFRPVGIAVAPDGSLYISDWVDKSYTLHGQGRIWRLRYGGSRCRPCIAQGSDATSSGKPPRGSRHGHSQQPRLRGRCDERLVDFVASERVCRRASTGRWHPAERGGSD